MGGFPFVIRAGSTTVTVTNAVTVTKTCVAIRARDCCTHSTEHAATKAVLRVRVQSHRSVERGYKSPLTALPTLSFARLTIWRALACMHARDACELARAIGMVPLSAQHRPSSPRRRPVRRRRVAGVECSTDAVITVHGIKFEVALDAARPSAITRELLATITQLCRQAVGWSVVRLALCASNKRGG